MNVMKKIISYAASFLIIASVAAAPGSKLVEQFKATFPNAQNVKWVEDKQGYFVSFHQSGDFSKVLYNTAGDFVCSWKYSTGEGLPTSIVLRLNKKYSGSKIIGVTELTTEDDTLYEVKASKGSKLYSITFSSGGTILNESKFNNQNADETKG